MFNAERLSERSAGQFDLSSFFACLNAERFSLIAGQDAGVLPVFCYGAPGDADSFLAEDSFQVCVAERVKRIFCDNFFSDGCRNFSLRKRKFFTAYVGPVRQ